MRLIKRAVHIDFHTMADIPDFGVNFDAMKFAQTLKDAHVDYINAFAKCNIGFAYYPTKIGIVHPHLDFDMLGQTVEECHKLGIGVTAYFNVGLDHEMARKHRDWTTVNKEGQVISGDRTANFFRNMCINSPYRAHILGMIREVVEQYPVDGIFLDCMAIVPCYGNECLEAIRDRGGDPLDDQTVLDFNSESWLSFLRQVKEVVGDDKFLYLNGQPRGNTEGLNTHAEIECLPSGGWGYDYFPAEVAYARNIDSQTFYMTGRFNVSWGDFGGLKSKESLENDCWDAISNAAQTSIGDHMHPRDGLDPAVYKVIGEIYQEIEKLEPWTENAKAVADIGIVNLRNNPVNEYHASLGANFNGAVRMLGELKYTYDIIDERHDFSRYKVLILPDEIIINEELKTKLQRYIADGGGIISSGHSGLNEDKSTFALDEWKMNYDGEDTWNSSYFKMLKDTDGKVPDMLCGIYHQSILLQGKGDTEAIADYFQPYFNRHWDGFQGYFYTPPEKYAGRPAVVRAGNIFQICFAVFTSYIEGPTQAHKYLIDYCIQQLLPEPVIKCENIPSTARVTLTEKDSMKMIHVKISHPEPRGKLNIIEDHQTLTDAVVYLKTDNVNAVYLAPGKEPLQYTKEGNYIRIELPKIEGYMMIVVE